VNVKVIVFDLDDTLYDEITFVRSGFRAVGEHFMPLGTEAMFEEMARILERDGRGDVFDNVLQKFGLYSKENVKKALGIYRSHTPKIELNADAKEMLEYYKTLKTPLYLVTDGNKNVQANKIKALGVEKLFKHAFITHRYGKIHAKPSPYCFIKIAQKEGVKYEDILYVADNVNKDFVNIKKLGFRTIRIKQGMFAKAQKPQEFHAEREINSLLELKNILKG
jgi:putative hydrolase of the HAD superfamily